MNNSERPPLADLAITVDVVLFTIEDNQLKVLLITRDNDPFKGMRALPGGFLWKGETTRQAAERLLKVKGGVSDVYMEQLYTFDEQDRDPRGAILSVAYLAFANRSDLKINASNDTQDPKLYAVTEIHKLAFDHSAAVKRALDRVTSKLEYTNLAYSLLPPAFTFQELQTVYEAVLQKPLDKRNFRKKFASLNLIEPTGESVRGKRHRPAELYRFIDSKPVEIKRWF